MSTPLLEVRDLTVSFQAGDEEVSAVRGMNFHIAPGEVLALVGESGAGKSATAMAVVGLLPEHAEVTGSVKLQGKELVGLDDAAMSNVRGRVIGTVFQDPMSALTPVYTVGDQIAEALQQGDSVAVFPEGTTADGHALLPFHANLLQAAISANAPTQPVAINFFDTATGRFSAAAAYVGDETLLQSLWRTLCALPITVRVSFGAVQTAQGRDRRTWAAALRDEIAALRSR